MATYESQIENMKLVALQEGWSSERYEEKYLKQRRWAKVEYPDASRSRRKYIAEERFWAKYFLDKHGVFPGEIFRDPSSSDKSSERGRSESYRRGTPERSRSNSCKSISRPPRARSRECERSRSRRPRKRRRRESTWSKSSSNRRDGKESGSYPSGVDEFGRTRTRRSHKTKGGETISRSEGSYCRSSGERLVDYLSPEHPDRHYRPPERSQARLRYDDWDYGLTRSSSRPENRSRPYRQRSKSPRDTDPYKGRAIKSYDDIKAEYPGSPPRPISAIVQSAYKAQAKREPLRLRDKERAVEKMRTRRVWQEQIKVDFLKQCPSNAATNAAEDYPTPESLPEDSLISHIPRSASDSLPHVENNSGGEQRFETFVPAADQDDPVAIALNTDLLFASKNGRPRFSVLLTQWNAQATFIGHEFCHLRYLRLQFPRFRFLSKTIDAGLLVWMELKEKDMTYKDSGILGDILISEAEKEMLDIAMRLLRLYAESEGELPDLDKFIDRFFAGRYD